MHRVWFAAGPLAALALACAAPARVAAQDAKADVRYSPAATVSPQAAALLTPMMAAQAATRAKREAMALDFAAMRAANEQGADAAMAAVGRLGVRATPETLGGVAVLRVVPPRAASDGRVLVYVHGGGWIMGSPRSSVKLAMLFAVATGVPVVSVDYGLVPQHDYRDITGQVSAVYRALLAQGHSARQIALFGDSAGGSIVAGSTLRLRDEGLPLPAALVLLSPCTDLGNGGDTRTTLAAYDPVLDIPSWYVAVMRAYAGSPAGMTNPWASPVYGDYHKPFPPTLIQGGTREALLSDFVREHRAIRAGGGEAVLDLYEGMPHVFQSYLAETPEGRQALATARDFLLSHLAGPKAAPGRRSR
jgi:acetyl esterase/lipase